MKNLYKSYKKKKEEIKKRLRKFKKILNQSDEKIFYELCYCIMTANGSARAAMEAQKFLEKNEFWSTGRIDGCLENVRFGNRKCEYIVSNRNNLINDKISLKQILKGNNLEIREYLVKNKKYFKGLNYKEASHFLRNVGLGENLAILDRHILKNLLKYGVIEEIPKNLTKQVYLHIENKMRKFSQKINISMEELDLLFWSDRTGFVFK